MRRKEFIIYSLMGTIGLGIKVPDDNEDVGKNSEQEKLNKFLISIESEFNRNRIIVENNDIFGSFKKSDRRSQVEDYSQYFPFYKAGEKKYNVPWLLLWIVHEQETGVSRHPNPESSGYLGGMQRDGSFYSEEYVRDAYFDWEFLNLLPQRYKRVKGDRTTDFEEIMFAAKKIRSDANMIKTADASLTDEEGLLKAQYRYCAYFYATQRINAYQDIKNLFNKRRLPTFE